MRVVVICCCLAACGGAAAVIPRTPAPRPVAPDEPAEPDREPIDPITALTPAPPGLDGDPEASWVVPGPIQLELGGATVAAAAASRPIKVAVIDEQGNLERVALQLEHARFSVWIDRSHLLSVVTRDQRIEPPGVPVVGSDVEVVLRAGARVRRIGHREGATQVRYVGALQVEGWVPDAALADRGHARDGGGRIPTGRKTLMVIPGAVIRAEPQWASAELAIMANGYYLDTLQELDDAWTEVSYEDSEVAVHGFVSKRDPPGRVHRWHDSDGATSLTPNATAASGTCLYARPGGDAVGYIVGSREVDLGAVDAGWWSLAIDTPWGPLAFAARGSTAGELVACAPADALPAGSAPAP